MSVGTKVALSSNYRIGGPPKDFVVSKLQVQQVLDIPNFNPEITLEEGNIAYSNGKLVFYNGATWEVVTSGVSEVSNAPDPSPGANFLVNSPKQLRNLKTAGNGIAIQTLGNSVLFNYDPQFTAPPASVFITPWAQGRYTAIYSNTLTITQDSNNNFSIESMGGGTTTTNAPNPFSLPVSRILNENSHLRLLTPSDGITIEQSIPDTNYIRFKGYDQTEEFTTNNNTPYAISVPILPGQKLYYDIRIRGANETTQKLYYFEYKRGVKNISGSIIFQTPVANFIDLDGDSVSVTFTLGTNEFFINVTGLPLDTINWKMLLRRI